MALVPSLPALSGPMAGVELPSPAEAELLPFKLEDTHDGGIYESLADHQRTEDWRYRAFIGELQRWAGIFDEAFELKVPEVSLGIDGLRVTRLGQFRGGHNPLGLKGEIILNDRHFSSRHRWQILGTLLHELLHGWQQAHGRPGKHNYHNVQFRRKARQFGLIIDPRGHTEYDPDGRFFDLLREHGVDLPELPPRPPRIRVRGESKLKKWSCGCTNVRVAVEDFHALCLRCGHGFVRCD